MTITEEITRNARKTRRGPICFDRCGYPVIHRNGKKIPLHIYVWDSENGPKPDGMDIHHRDGNRENFDISNLELMTKSDHKRIHKGWIRVGGIWIAKPCSGCGRILPLDHFYPSQGIIARGKCKDCLHKYYSAKYLNTKEDT